MLKVVNSDFNRTGLHHGDLLEKFKENNLAKVKVEPPRMFSLTRNLTQSGVEILPVEIL